MENREAVLAAASFPYIPFKSNATGGAGDLWQQLCCYCVLFREEFLEHYHAHSNVESAFSMIKRKVGDHLRSRTDVAMRNEALAKIVCHSICCVIQAQCERKIQPTFWDEPEVPPEPEALVPETK